MVTMYNTFMHTCIDLDRLILPAYVRHSMNSKDEDVIFQRSAVIGCVPTSPLIEVILHRKDVEGEFIQV